MKGKIFYALVTSMTIGSIAYGQTTVKGKIKDNQGKDLANITISSGKKQTQSNSKGQFELFIPENGSFQILLSGVGYQKETLSINPEGKITELNSIILQKSDQQIDQVEVLGYNSINNKKVGVAKSGIDNKDLPQSVQIINNQVITDQQANTLADALKNANGIALGADRGGVNENFFARGYSLGSNNIFKNGSRSNNGGRMEASTLESVEILKGSAALLYGGVSGGAVVNLVTKRPKFENGGEVSFRIVSGPTSQSSKYFTFPSAIRSLTVPATSSMDTLGSKRCWYNNSIVSIFRRCNEAFTISRMRSGLLLSPAGISFILFPV